MVSARLARVLLPCALATTSCAWVPDGGQLGYDRGMIPEATRAAFVPGQTTRADVLCALGAPDWVSANEERMLYRVRVVRSYWWAYLVGGLPITYFCDIRTHLFEFDERARLASYRRVEESRSDAGDGGPGPLLSHDMRLKVDFARYFDAAR